MTMIDCLRYVNERKLILKEQIANFENKPCLAVIQVGNDEASNVYIKNKKKACEEVGICFVHMKLPEYIHEDRLVAQINSFNNTNSIHGIIVQFPLPIHMDAKYVTDSIAKEKDVDGFRSDSLFKPCTPKGIVDWLKYNQIDLVGKDVCVIGRSKIVGKPMVEMMSEEHATVIWCHSKTKDLKRYTRNANIVVSAIGKANYFDASYFNKGQIVVDVGINRDSKNKLCGDVCSNVSKLVEYKTPVPNGVGKLTVCSLLENTVKAYRLNGGI